MFEIEPIIEQVDLNKVEIEKLISIDFSDKDTNKTRFSFDLETDSGLQMKIKI